MTPYSLVFKTEDHKDFFLTLELFLDSAFFIDLFINFSTAYYDDDLQIVDNRKVRFIKILNRLDHC